MLLRFSSINKGVHTACVTVPVHNVLVNVRCKVKMSRSMVNYSTYMLINYGAVRKMIDVDIGSTSDVAADGSCATGKLRRLSLAIFSRQVRYRLPRT